MTVRSKALSLFFWFLTPCGVSTGILSFGGGIVVSALGGGSGIWSVLVEFAFLCFFFFLPSFFLLLPWGVVMGPWLPPFFNLRFTWLTSQAQM